MSGPWGIRCCWCYRVISICRYICEQKEKKSGVSIALWHRSCILSFGVVFFSIDDWKPTEKRILSHFGYACAYLRYDQVTGPNNGEDTSVALSGGGSCRPDFRALNPIDSLECYWQGNHHYYDCRPSYRKQTPSRISHAWPTLPVLWNFGSILIVLSRDNVGCPLQ